MCLVKDDASMSARSSHVTSSKRQCKRENSEREIISDRAEEWIELPLARTRGREF